jgi:adenylate cyclase
MAAYRGQPPHLGHQQKGGRAKHRNGKIRISLSNQKAAIMPTEIERKFLVQSDRYIQAAQRSERISQGYLCSHPDRTVRVRIKGGSGFLTIKGRSSQSGLSRYEWEKEITTAEAHELLALCEPGVIDKIRYEVPVGSHLFEVDCFLGQNEGLVVAEVELQSEEEPFEVPSWLGAEVTGDRRYYNSYIAQNPFCSWPR